MHSVIRVLVEASLLSRLPSLSPLLSTKADREVAYAHT